MDSGRGRAGDLLTRNLAQGGLLILLVVRYRKWFVWCLEALSLQYLEMGFGCEW